MAQTARKPEPWDEETTAVTKAETMDMATASGMFDLRENMKGVEARLPQVRIIHQAQMFELPNGEKANSIEGVILDISRANAYWMESFDTTGGGTPPDCFSMDGVKPDPYSGHIQAATCAECSQNKFGSDGARGKACKNLKRLHIVMDGDILPTRLTIPPSNLKPVDMYVTLLVSKGIPYQLVTTKLSLKRVQNKDGIGYSELVLQNSGAIQSMETAMKIKNMRNEFLQIMRGQSIQAEEI